MLNFIGTYFGITSLLAIVMIATLVYMIIKGVEIKPEEALHKRRYSDQILSDNALRLSIMWTICVWIASAAEALIPLEERFALEGNNMYSPLVSALVTTICFSLMFFIVCDLISKVLIELKLRYLVTEALNMGKK